MKIASISSVELFALLRRDIDLDQLEVQLWSGQVQLKNLELDVSALNVPGLRCSKAQLGCAWGPQMSSALRVGNASETLPLHLFMK
eukprot:s2682_g7.t1